MIITGFVGLSNFKKFSRLNAITIRLINSSEKEQQNNLPAKLSSPSSVYRYPVESRHPIQQKFIKKIKVEYHGVDKSKFQDDDATIWYPIYRFPYLHACKYLIKTKVYLTLFSISIGLSQLISFFLDPQKVFLTNSLIVSSATLAGMLFTGDWARKLVCQIYTSADCEFIRFCRFTFFARRLDMVVPASSVIPLTENNITIRKLILEIKLKPPNEHELMEGDTIEYYEEKFHLCLKFGGVSDMERFERALGKILSRKIIWRQGRKLTLQ